MAELEAKLGLPPKTPDNSSTPPSQGKKPSADPIASGSKGPRASHPGAHRPLHPDPTRRRGKILDADYQRQWLDSPEPKDPSKPLGQKYGYGIAQMTFGPNSLYFHGGEMPGYNSFMGYDPVNDVTLIVWTNLTISLDGQPTANSIMLKMLDRIYTVLPLQQSQ